MVAISMNDLEHRVRLALLEIDGVLEVLEELKGHVKGIEQIISQVKRMRIAVERIRSD